MEGVVSPAAGLGGMIGGLAGGVSGVLTEGALTWASGQLSGAFAAGAAGAVALRAGSRIVPHMPQKRKLLELTSPHFGQITGFSGFLFLECNSERAVRLRIGGTGDCTVGIPNPY